jgi:phage terminase small subunit
MTKPSKLTPKQEAFALTYVETGNASEAYRRAYDVASMAAQTIWNEASAVLSNRYVTIRIMELQQAAAERTLVTVESITREYEEVRSKAIVNNDLAPANAAITGKAKVNGLLVDKQLLQGDANNPITHVHKIERVIVRANPINTDG